MSVLSAAPESLVPGKNVEMLPFARGPGGPTGAADISVVGESETMPYHRVCGLQLETTQSQRVSHHRNRRSAHRESGEHGADEDAEKRIERTSGNWYARPIID